MKAMIIEKYGHTPLKQVDIPKPKLRKDDILVEIHAASINPVDFKIRNGTMRMIEKYKMPIVLGNDFAGVVKEVGKKHTNLKWGTRFTAERVSSGQAPLPNTLPLMKMIWH